ncbi:MAG TPA: hypothetical protein VH501_10680 [Solirubrobacterales bacterium]|jgi:hypothetical protein
MRISKRVPGTVFVAAAAALTAALAVGALSAIGSEHGHGKGHGGQALRESLAPSVPDDPALHGVIPGNAPWVLKEGSVRLDRHSLDLRVRGLVIPVAPGNGTPGPVNTISASLYCGADSDTMAVQTSGQVPISRDGDARIRDRSFDLPASCLSPVILVHPNGNTTAYITVDGWRM